MLNWNTLYPAVSPGNDTIVAVIDTGYTPHSNFLSQLSGSQSSTPCTSTNKASLGGFGACSTTMQQAINSAVSAGIIVVAAAGNATVNQDGLDYTIYNVADINPANCKNVISVSAKNHNNGLSWYSSYGNTTITASGGGSFRNGYNIYSTLWASKDSYVYSLTNSTYIEYQGTSQATPHVSAVIADLITYFNQIKIQYSASNLIDILQSSSSALTNTSNLSDITRGQGGTVPNRTLNAQSALIYAIKNYIILAQPSSLTFTSLEPQVVVFTNTITKEMNVLTAAIINSSNVGLTIVADECSNISLDVGASCSVTVSPTKLGITQATLKLTNDGETINLVPISVNNPISTNSSGAGGGGCSATQNGDDASLLFILLAISVIYYARRRLYKNN